MSVPQHALLIEIRERAGGIVLRLQRAVAFAAIDLPENVRRVITVGIERFDPGELHHLGFNLAVEISGLVLFLTSRDIPETEVHVELSRLQRIERKAVRLRTGTNRANPNRRDANLALEKAQESVRVLERDIDVLDHRFGVPALQPGPRPRHTPSRVPAHEPLVRPRAK